MKKSLLVDINGILIPIILARKSQNPLESFKDNVGLYIHILISDICKQYEIYKPTDLIFAFEGGDNWRKTYTKENGSRRVYKGNRVFDKAMNVVFEALENFKKFIIENTSIKCLTVSRMEADDVIAAYCQMFASDTHYITILSIDKDFIQLLKLQNVKLVTPEGKYRNQPDDKNYEPDLDYWLFEKCIRGDVGDNVLSAFPKVRSVKLKKAFNNDYDMSLIMNTEWEDENKKLHKVSNLFNENKILLSLFDHPDDIKVKLFEGVKQNLEMSNGKYNHFKFLSFLEKYNLQEMKRDSHRFINMFQVKTLIDKTENSSFVY